MPVTIPTNVAAGLSNVEVPTPTPRAFTGGYPIKNVDLNPASIINTRINETNLTKYSYPSDLPKYHFVIIETDWSFASKTLTPTKLFRLPLPTPLLDQFEVNFDRNFNYLGEAAKTISSFSDLIGQGVASLAKAAGAASGLTLNTFKTVTMSVPDFRTFQFTWKLSPKNFAESREIQRINYALRKGMSPRTTASKFLLVFPKIYIMYFNPNPQYLYKFKPCVLTTLSVDYAGGNPFPAFYKQQNNDNPPESVTISTTWLEVEFWLENDYHDDPAFPDLPSKDPFSGIGNYTGGITIANTAPQGGGPEG